jgi:hypothetical protein
LTVDQISGQCWKSVKMIFRPATFDRDVIVIDESNFVETVLDPDDRTSVSLRPATMQEPDHRDCRLLCAPRKRPRRRRCNHAV